MQLLNTFLDLLAPAQCLGCNNEGKLLCDWCFDEAFNPVPSRCAFCLRQQPDFTVCKACRKRTPLRQVWVTTTYDGLAKQLVRQMKFNPDRSACVLIARWLHETLPYFEDVAVSFVPTARRRVRVRGFDHAENIAREFARRRALPFTPTLDRLGNTRQVGSHKQTRITQLKHAYQPKHAKLPPAVLLIDDIITTGATLSETARVLKQAGVREVRGVAFAQAL